MARAPMDVRDMVAVATFDSYDGAERAVDSLSDSGFPVEKTKIVGVGLRLVEHVLGRLTYPRAAGMGAAAGAWFGLLFGVFVAVFTTSVWWWLTTILSALLWGAVAGAVFGLVAHAFTGGRRDFISSKQLLADRYEVLVDPVLAQRANEMLLTDRP
ncbi:general stress protein [Allokutzneria oryzae]|uniref:General stress protein n=1 Tax=Allokutzneria oryzae TaxID=1378989 RepID=A0ABV5ZRF9_9PSEU